jgi:hypothetical protein
MEQLDDELNDAWKLLGQSAKASDFSARRHDQKIEPLSEELRSAAGHSARNMFRDRHELSWRDILIEIPVARLAANARPADRERTVAPGERPAAPG